MSIQNVVGLIYRQRIKLGCHQMSVQCCVPLEVIYRQLTSTCQGTETVWITLLRRSPVSSPQSECAGCRQQGHAGSKTLHQQNNPVLNRRCQLMQVDLYNGHKMVVVIAVVAGAVNFNNFFFVIRQGLTLYFCKH